MIERTNNDDCKDEERPVSPQSKHCATSEWPQRQAGSVGAPGRARMERMYSQSDDPIDPPSSRLFFDQTKYNDLSEKQKSN